MFELPFAAKSFKLVRGELWAIVGHAYVWDAIPCKLGFQLVDDDGLCFGIIQCVHFPES